MKSILSWPATGRQIEKKNEKKWANPTYPQETDFILRQVGRISLHVLSMFFLLVYEVHKSWSNTFNYVNLLSLSASP